MKKKVIITVAILMGSFLTKAQAWENVDKVNKFKKKVFISVGKTLTLAMLDGGDTSPLINHFAIDFRVKQKLTLGLSYTETAYFMQTIMEGSVDMNRRNVSVKLNFILDEKVFGNDEKGYYQSYDGYISVKAGISEHKEDDFVNGNYAYIPTVHVGLGGHFYFTQHFGINGEVGIGSPFLAQVGITVKL